MKNIIDELFYGNIRPSVQLVGITEKFKDTEDKLLGLLNGKENELMRRYIRDIYLFNEETARENFKHGFKLGSLFFTEALK